MCGITAILLSETSKLNCFDILIESLKSLQNRGYDSCGIIDGEFKCLLREIKSDIKSDINNISDVIEKLILKKNQFPENTLVGMAHTRWATHGKKTVLNAHPHISYDGKVAIVHNGIIENYQKLKEELIRDGWLFQSETDTEVISNWVARELKQISNVTIDKIIDILYKANIFLEGTWAISLIYKDIPNSVFVMRKGNPLLIGYDQSGNIMVSSEISGFVNRMTKYGILKEGNVICLTSGLKIDKQNIHIEWKDIPSEKIDLNPGKFPYFMLKEIYEQEKSVYGPCNWKHYASINEIPELLQLNNFKNKEYDILLIGCGTSYHSGLASKHFFSSFRTVQCFIASEFSIEDIPKGSNSLAIFISQSGETLDTYKALNLIKNIKNVNNEIKTLALVNVDNSLLARECNYVIYLHAGREVGVASTKSYISQIIGLYLISMYFKNNFNIDDLLQLSSQIKQILDCYFKYTFENTDSNYKFICPKKLSNIVDILNKKNHGFILSTGNQLATSYEASLKIKEIGRVFIEGHSTSSLKHGSFSLIEKELPILFVLQNEKDCIKKTNTTIEEVYLRGAFVYVITDIQDYTNEKAKEIIIVPYNKTFSNILTIIPFQIISYYLSEERGFNCDFPINLAKCVTTE